MAGFDENDNPMGENECPACPEGCNSCTRDADCECYDHGNTYETA